MGATLVVQKQLAQRMPITVDVQLLYQVPNINTRTLIKTLIVCNTTAAAKTYSIWINQAGIATADQFALRKTIALAANASDQIIYPGDGALILNGDGLHSSASILCQASVASAVTFTLYGVEITET